LQDLYGDRDIFIDRGVEDNINNSETDNILIDELDADLSINDI
jgi:hypothetical protein